MLVFGHDREIAHWVGEQLESEFDPTAKAIGVAREGKLICGVVYHNYRPPKNIEMSIASINPRWATKQNLQTFFNYPFLQLGCSRVTVITDAGNVKVQKFLERLGFQREGLLRDANPDDDAVIYGILKSECKWI